MRSFCGGTMGPVKGKTRGEMVVKEPPRGSQVRGGIPNKRHARRRRRRRRTGGENQSISLDRGWRKKVEEGRGRRRTTHCALLMCCGHRVLKMLMPDISAVHRLRLLLLILCRSLFYNMNISCVSGGGGEELTAAADMKLCKEFETN